MLALFPWGDSDPPGAWGAQPERCRGPEMVTGGNAWQQGQVGESGGRRDLVPLINGCLALRLLRGTVEKSHRLMSDCYCAQHWVVL